MQIKAVQDRSFIQLIELGFAEGLASSMASLNFLEIPGPNLKSFTTA